MKPWRTHEAQLLTSGLNSRQVADRIGRSRDAVSQYARSRRICMPRRALRIVPAMKVCRHCGYWLSHSEFYADLRNADGLTGTCKGCQREKARASIRRRRP